MNVNDIIRMGYHFYVLKPRRMTPTCTWRWRRIFLRFVDRVEIEQVVLNLLQNAIEAVSAVPKRRRVVSIATRGAEIG